MSKKRCSPGDTDSASILNCALPRQRGGRLLQKKFLPGFPIRYLLCKWGIWISTTPISLNHMVPIGQHYASWLVIMEKFWLEREGLSTLVKRGRQELPYIGDSLGINEQSIVRKAKSSVWGSYQYTEYVRSPCQQMVARFLLFRKFAPSVDHEESMSADKFLLGVHIKWIFLLGVHISSFDWNLWADGIDD